MISTAIDNALIAYAKTATGLTTVIWGRQNTAKASLPFVVITPLALVDDTPLGILEKNDKLTAFKRYELRFDVFTSDLTHMVKASGLIDAANSEDIRLDLAKAGVTYITNLSEVVDSSELQDSVFRRRATVDLVFGVYLERSSNYGAIEKITGEVFGVEFEVKTEDYEEPEED